MFPGQEKGPAQGRAGKGGAAKAVPLPGSDLGDLRGNFHRMLVVAFHPLEPRTAAEHAVEFVDQQVERFHAIIGSDRAVEVGSLDFDVSFRHELVVVAPGLVVFELDPQADDSILVPEKSGDFLPGDVLEGLREVHVDAREDEFVTVVFLMVFIGHSYSIVGWITDPNEGKPVSVPGSPRHRARRHNRGQLRDREGFHRHDARG